MEFLRCILLIYFVFNNCGHVHQFESKTSGSSDEVEKVILNSSHLKISDLKYIGCYDVWKGRKGVSTHSTMFRKDLSLEGCRSYCKGKSQDQAPSDILLLRGMYCGCMSWTSFNHYRVDEEKCNLKCADSGVTNDDAYTCGGNYGFSMYCNTTGVNAGRCNDFIPQEVVHTPDDTLEYPVLVPETETMSHPLPCFSCKDPFRCTVVPFNSSFDYFPQNSPGLCMDFCKQNIIDHTGTVIERRRTNYAIVGWNNRDRIPIPICWCKDDKDSNFEEIDTDFCKKPCPDNSDEMCGGNPPNDFAMYCSNLDYCSGVTTETMSTIPRTTSKTTGTTSSWSDTDTTFESTSIEGSTALFSNPTPPLESSVSTSRFTTTETPTTTIILTTEDPTTTTETTSTMTETRTSTETQTKKPETSTTTSTLTTDTSKITTTMRPGPVTLPPKTTPKTTAYPCGLSCHAEFNSQYWIACAGKTARNDCPRNAYGQATWKCSDMGSFIGDIPDYTECSSRWLELIDIGEDEILTEEKADNILNIIISKVSEGNVGTSNVDYFGHEILKILEIMAKVFNQLIQNIEISCFENLTEKAVAISENILINNPQWNELPMRNRSRLGTDLIFLIENIVFNFTAKATIPFSSPVKRKLMDGQYRKFYRSQHIGIQISSGAQSIDETGTSTLRFPFQNELNDGSYIELPSGWVNHVQGQNLNFMGSAIASEFIKIILPLSNNKNEKTNKLMNGKLMSFSLANLNKNIIIFPGKGITVHFKHDMNTSSTKTKELRRRQHSNEEPKPVYKSSQCVFWNTQKLEWSSYGCKLVSSEQTGTTCECSHLTSFALLMDMHNFVGKDFGLEILTLVICPLSIICLVITILVFTLFRSTHSPRTAITKNLCISLLLGNTSILFIVDRHYFNMSDGLCITSAIITHYIFLTAFMWMGVEGYHLYKMVVHVFDSGKNHINFYRIVSYGIPLLIVGATTASSFLNNGQAYGGEMFCWLQGNYIWTFLGPAAIIVLGNTVTLFITLRTAHKVHSSTVQIYNQIQSNRTWTKGCLSLTIILGLTWIVGFFMLTDSVISLIVAYIFTILNASQGIFLFVLHCLLDDKVLVAARRRDIPIPAWMISRKQTISKSKSGENMNAFFTKGFEEENRNDKNLGPSTPRTERRRRSQPYDHTSTISSLDSIKTRTTSLSGNESSESGSVINLTSALMEESVI